MKAYITEMITKWKTSFTNLKKLRHKYSINGTEFYSIKIDQIQYYLFNILYTSTDYYVDNNEEYMIDVMCYDMYGDDNRYPLILLINGFDGIEDIISGTTIMFPKEDSIVDMFSSFVKETYETYIDDSIFLLTSEEIQSFTYKLGETLENEIFDKFYDTIVEIGGV